MIEKAFRLVNGRPVEVSAEEHEERKAEEEQARVATWRRNVDYERDRRIANGFMYEGISFQLDAKSRAAIALTAESGKIPWIATDNSIHVVDRDRFMFAASDWASKLMIRARALKDQAPAEDVGDDKLWE